MYVVRTQNRTRNGSANRALTRTTVWTGAYIVHIYSVPSQVKYDIQLLNQITCFETRSRNINWFYI